MIQEWDNEWRKSFNGTNGTAVRSQEAKLDLPAMQERWQTQAIPMQAVNFVHGHGAHLTAANCEFESWKEHGHSWTIWQILTAASCVKSWGKLAAFSVCPTTYFELVYAIYALCTTNSHCSSLGRASFVLAGPGQSGSLARAPGWVLMWSRSRAAAASCATTVPRTLRKRAEQHSAEALVRAQSPATAQRS